MKNESLNTQNFFSNVVNGLDQKPINPFKYECQSKNNFKKFAFNEINKVFESYQGYFDLHIVSSIPNYRNNQINVIWYLVNNLTKFANVLQIGGSEGTLLKVLKHFRPDLNLYNLEPNKDMIEKNDPNKITVLPFAFYEGFENIKAYKPSYKFDAIIEIMTFQFISDEREIFINHIKQDYLNKNGLFITYEKFQDVNKERYQYNEEIKNRFKSLHFSTEQMQVKADSVLIGMSKLQYDFSQYERLLNSNFSTVKRFKNKIECNFHLFICTL